jgi:hypothetical protein
MGKQNMKTTLSHDIKILDDLMIDMIDMAHKSIEEGDEVKSELYHARILALCHMFRMEPDLEAQEGFIIEGVHYDDFKDALARRSLWPSYQDIVNRDAAQAVANEVDKHKAVWLKVDGTWEVVTPKNGTNFKLEELYEFISTNGNKDCCADIIPLRNKGKIFVGEDNAIQLGYPTNLAASLYCNGLVLMEACGIVGNCLICDDAMVE